MAATVIPLIAWAVIIIVIVAAVRANRGPRGPLPAQNGGEEAVRAYGLVLRDKLDRALFGPVLAGQVWDRVITRPVGEGLIHEFHRDYCGHGLIRTQGGVKLCDILDGHHPGAAIAEWRSREDFVAFFAEQSDYSCSGWDEGSPVFFTDDEWHRNNQRLTRKKLLRFV
ncbi:hypothetical protein [Bosea sp. (in: a-proteobacteria)]|jgi:hypothetical protein|uniref:hypothetical protein n=1 Tax=Bosea sp. (in: a-proteobacteria) TaxID=1871050 RepID=UPI002DDD25B0|nr:hypothetical protein [Bosea sp. (in: a-proteobacteria)]HEV2508854.1 hypothetical protein [Bosea sp. (in: a-proteobacteria)]